MAYEKYEWHKGEIITADKLNNMENRIEEAASSGGERFIIECTLDEENSTRKERVFTHNVTLQEAYEAFESGKEIYAKLNLEPAILYVHLNNIDHEDDTIVFTAAFHNPTSIESFADNNLFIYAFSEDNKISMRSPSKIEPIVFRHEYNSKVSSSDTDTATCNYTSFTDILALLSINAGNAIVKEHDSSNIMPDKTNFGFLPYYVNNGSTITSIVFSRIMSSDRSIVEIQICYNKDNTITYDRNILYEVQAN